MTDEQKEARRIKARARAQAWRERLVADPEAHAAEKARHAAACRAARVRAAAARPPKPPREETPEEERLAAKRAYYARWMAKPGVRAEQTRKARGRLAANLDAVNARRRELRASRRPAYRLRLRPTIEARRPFAGSVLNASAASPDRDMLATVTALVGAHFDREEVVSEAMLMVLEGAAPRDAVARAKTAVGRFTRMQFLSVAVEDCHWL